MGTITAIFAEPLGWALSGLYAVFHSYGISLVILTVIVKICLYPLYAKQIKSMSGMSAMQPQINEIQNKYSDKQERNEKLSEFYKKNNVNPAAGCLPMLVQMIVIMGLFALLRNPITYLGNSESMLYAVHESFFWIDDLSQPDKWILPIAAGIATFISFTMSQRNQPNTNTAMPGGMNMGGMMKTMRFFFPVMIVLMARAYPAGLATYWFLSQIIQIAYNIRFRKLREDIVEDNLRRKERN